MRISFYHFKSLCLLQTGLRHYATISLLRPKLLTMRLLLVLYYAGAVDMHLYSQFKARHAYHIQMR